MRGSLLYAFYGPRRTVIKIWLYVENDRMTDIHRVFCMNLKKIRSRKFTQEQMAEIMGNNTRTYQRLEDGYQRGEKWPTPDMIKRLAKILKCETTDFFKPIKK